MHKFRNLLSWLTRLRYPVALPEEIAQALGIPLSNTLPFEEVVKKLQKHECCATRLRKYMPRAQAEDAFKKAQKKEQFHHCTLCSFYFQEGWLEFQLQFDEQERLRRVYLQHYLINEPDGVEVTLQPPLVHK